MQKTIAVFVVAICCAGVAHAKGGGHATSGSHHVAGYTKKNGTQVAPHHATNPNNTKRDNWSSKGNTNPHTGKDGTKNPDARGK